MRRSPDSQVNSRRPFDNRAQPFRREHHTVDFDPFALVRRFGMSHLPPLENLDDFFGNIAHGQVLIAGGEPAFTREARLMGRTPQNFRSIVNI